MTREWKKQPTAYEYPNEVNTYHLYGMRNDDMCFMIYSRLPLEEAYKELDTFLDPKCECVVGKNCEMHHERWLKWKKDSYDA